MPSPVIFLVLITSALEADTITSLQLETLLSWLPWPHVPLSPVLIDSFPLFLKGASQWSGLSLMVSLCCFVPDNSLNLQLDAATYDIYISKP